MPEGEAESRFARLVRRLLRVLRLLFRTAAAAAVVGLLVWAFLSRGEWPARRLIASAEGKWRQADYLGAVRDYETIIAAYKTASVLPEAYYSKGVLLYLFLDDPAGAAAAFEEYLASETGPEDEAHLLTARKHLAEIYEKKLKRPIDAIALYEGVIEASRDPEEKAKTRLRIGEIYYGMGDMDQARVEWDLLAARYPESRHAPEALYRKGGTYFETGRCKEATAVYTLLANRYPDDEMAAFGQFRAADCLEMNKKPTEALALYRALKGRYPDEALLLKKIAALEKRAATP